MQPLSAHRRLVVDAFQPAAIQRASARLQRDWHEASHNRCAQRWLKRLSVGGQPSDQLVAFVSRQLAKPQINRICAASLGLMTDAMAGQRFVALPLRHFTNGIVHTLMLASHGPLSLSLSLIDGAAHAARQAPDGPDIASFMPGQLWMRVLAGEAMIRMVDRQAADGALDTHQAEISAGDVICLSAARHALLIDRIPRFIVTLRLFLRDEAAIACDVELSSGRVVHQASARETDSRAELALALLRSMERSDAAPLASQIALDASQPVALRWQAARETLAMDTATGLRLLCALAGREDDALSAPASATHAQLLQHYPDLAAA